jgi:hypothetical protein
VIVEIKRPSGTIARIDSHFRTGGEGMEFDQDKVDEITLALLWLTHFKDAGGIRAWKGHDWETMDRLFARDYISDPKSKAKSVALTEEGEKRSKELFGKYFSLKR